jgi:HEAT repeat protein/photosystem II stability/assembly factor-like uncharacterized protein
MAHRFINATLRRSWVRVSLAVALIIIGLAPIGVPIASDNSWRQYQTGPAAATIQIAQPFMYRLVGNAGASTQVQRSDDGGATWQDVAALPAAVQQLVAVAGNEQVVYARTPTSIWVSQDAGITWSKTVSLPSRPVALAVTGDKTGTVFVGTESMGLLRSNNQGGSWQSLDIPAAEVGAGAPTSITSLAINPEDESIVYAAAGFWTGTNPARFNPVGVFTSVDAGAHWFEVAPAALGSAPVDKLEPVPGQPLTVVAVDSAGERRLQMAATPELLAALTNSDPGLRAAAARAIGFTGDRAALPALLQGLRQDTDVLAGEQMGEAIGRLGDQSAVPSLLEALGQGNEAVQSRSALALGMLGAASAVPLLSHTLETGQPMAQRSAAEALAAIGTPEAISHLEAPLSSAPMTSARNAAMIGLEAAGAQAVGGLTEALDAQNPALRTNAAEMLGWLKAAQATPELSRALADTNPAVREQAAWALGEIGTVEARQALAQALPTETNAEVRQASQAALARLETLSPAAGAGASGWASGLLGALSRIPAGKWTFLVLATAAAVLILVAGSRAGRGEKPSTGARPA